MGTNSITSDILLIIALNLSRCVARDRCNEIDLRDDADGLKTCELPGGGVDLRQVGDEDLVCCNKDNVTPFCDDLGHRYQFWIIFA